MAPNTGRKFQKGERPWFGQNLPSERYNFLRICKIIRVDNEQGLVDVQPLEGPSEVRIQLPLPAAFRSVRGTINGMPEEGSIVVCGWTHQTNRLEDMVILSYLDENVENANEFKLTRGKTSKNLDEISSIREKIGYDIARSKRRKIYSGEIQAESTQGAELYLDDNVYLSNNKLNEIEIVSADQSIRLVSMQQYSDTQATRTYNGMIVRQPIDSPSASPTIFPNGKTVQIITDSNNPYHLGGKAFTEFRQEIREKANGYLNVTEVNAGQDITSLSPYITFVMGTLVGNDKNDISHYGKILRPQIFGSRFVASRQLDEIECLPEETRTLAAAFQLKLNNANSRIYIDKQGHLFTQFAASSGQHPLGGGRSWEGNFDGSIKWVIGKNQDENSIVLDTLGSIKETLGYDSLKGRSKETIAQRGIYTEILGVDADSNSYNLYAHGNIAVKTDKSYNIDVSGDYILTVSGKIQENIIGSKVENYINDKNNVIGGSEKTVIIKDQQLKIGASRDTTITGVSLPIPQTPKSATDNYKMLIGSKVSLLTAGDISDTLTLGDKKAKLVAGKIDNLVVAGKIVDTITTGNRETKVVTGNIKETVVTGNSTEAITTGNKKITVTTGNYKVDISAGNIDIITKSGKVTIDAKTQSVKINGLLKVTVNSGTKAEVTAPMVNLGATPARGGVVTGSPTPSHLDFICGIPLLGSSSVMASV